MRYLLVICFSLMNYICYSQQDIRILLSREVDSNAQTQFHDLSVPKGNWSAIFPKHDVTNISFDSVNLLNTAIVYDQTIFQAYKRGDATQGFLDNQIRKWGLDSTKLTDQTIHSYLSGIMAYKDGRPCIIIDKNANQKFEDDTVYFDEEGLGMHTVHFERFENDQIVPDSTRINIIRLDYKNKTIHFQFIDIRKGTFTLDNKEYAVNIAALLNDYDFAEFASVQFVDESGDSSKVYTQNDLVDLRGNTYKLSISSAGDTLTLSPYLNKERFSTQVGNYLPFFQGKNILGDTVALSDLKGTYVLVYFWNSSCSWSVSVLNQYVKEILLDEDELKLLSVAFDDILNIDEETKSFDPKYLIVQPANGEINKVFRVKVYPTYYLINPAGKVLVKSGVGVRLSTFTEEIKRAIKLDMEKTSI